MFEERPESVIREDLQVACNMQFCLGYPFIAETVINHRNELAQIVGEEEAQKAFEQCLIKAQELAKSEKEFWENMCK